jgi:hypothetical protein
VQNLLSSSLLSKIVKLKIYKTIILLRGTNWVFNPYPANVEKRVS